MIISLFGVYFDKETGTIYLRARNYDARIGRFITEDSFRGNTNDPLSLNLYTYCTNNPVMYWDPSGFNPATRKFGRGASTIYSFVPDVRLRNALVEAGGFVPFVGSAIVEGASDLFSGIQTISNDDLSSIAKASFSDLLDTGSIIGSASKSSKIKIFGFLSNGFTIFNIGKEMNDKSADINQIIAIMYGDRLWSRTRENLISKYVIYFDLVKTFVENGAVTYNRDFAGYVNDLNINEDAINKIISDSDFETKINELNQLDRLD